MRECGGKKEDNKVNIFPPTLGEGGRGRPGEEATVAVPNTIRACWM